jgi:hypothetical protein
VDGQQRDSLGAAGGVVGRDQRGVVEERLERRARAGQAEALFAVAVDALGLGAVVGLALGDGV